MLVISFFFLKNNYKTRKIYLSCRASKWQFPLALIELPLVNTSGRVQFSSSAIAIIFLSISLNMCFVCSKEPSHRDGSFEYPQNMFWMRNKDNIFPIHTLIWRPVCIYYTCLHVQPWFSAVGMCRLICSFLYTFILQCVNFSFCCSSKHMLFKQFVATNLIQYLISCVNVMHIFAYLFLAIAAQKIPLIKMVLLSTHSICFC